MYVNNSRITLILGRTVIIIMADYFYFLVDNQ